METNKQWKRVPFDVELAKKIQSGEIEGRIVTSENLLVRIVEFNLKDKTDSIVYIGTYANGKQEFIQTCDNEGKSFGAKVLYIELQEEAPKQKFKVGDKVKIVINERYPSTVGKFGTVVRAQIGSEDGHDIALYKVRLDGHRGTLFGLADDECLEHDTNHEFKPFDKVLVRSAENADWIATLYSHCDMNREELFQHVAGGCHWKYCIPYEGNEHLVGTTDNPE